MPLSYNMPQFWYVLFNNQLLGILSVLEFEMSLRLFSG